MAHDWQLIGLILALEFIFAAGVAFWTRWTANAKLQGQTIWHVAVGVAGVILLAGLRIGFGFVGFLLLCFTVAALPMGMEYFDRLRTEAAAAQKVREESVDVDTCPDRQE